MCWATLIRIRLFIKRPQDQCDRSGFAGDDNRVFCIPWYQGFLGTMVRRVKIR